MRNNFMAKRVFIIHGWGGYTEEGCFPWLKEELTKKGFAVFTPAMPEPLVPKIDAWVSFLKKQVGTPDENTYLVGHSIGAQTILRYLESLPADSRIGGAVFLAGWVHLTDEAFEDEQDREIGKPWLETPINWDVVKSHSNNFTAIFSDDDEVVPIGDVEIFKEKLGAEIIIEHNKDHFSGSSGIKELPVLLEELLKMME
jgi:predicted alpha/beta hydrolase family esterase